MQLLGFPVLQCITGLCLPACLHHIIALSVYRTAADNRLTTGGSERILKLVILFLGRSKLHRHDEDGGGDDNDNDDENLSRAECKAVLTVNRLSTFCRDLVLLIIEVFLHKVPCRLVNSCHIFSKDCNSIVLRLKRFNRVR
jgi:hypothetical protein